MAAYVARRLIQAVITLFVLTLLFFLLLRLSPGAGCAGATLGCTELLRLDQPIANQ